MSSSIAPIDPKVTTKVVNARDGQATTNQGKLDVYGTPLSFPGFARAYSGIYLNYRLMLGVPTLALCRAASRAVMKSAQWSVEADDDAPQDAIDLVQRCICDRRIELLNEMYRCVDYGNQPFEKVWMDGPDGALEYEELKPLLPDLTNVQVDQYGRIVALQNGGVTLGPEKFFYLNYDAEAGNVYGRSRLENLRTTAHRAWKDTLEKFGEYVTKVAGVQTVLYYPPGQATDSTGTVKDAAEIAKTCLDQMRSARGVGIPLLYDPATAEAMQNSPEFAKNMAWRFELMEAKGQHEQTFLEGLKWAEGQMARGYLWPERALTEGQFGTKAEAGVHQDLGVEIQFQDLQDMLVQLNRQVVADLILANYPDARWKVRVQASPLSDESIGFLREIAKGVLLDPNNSDLVAATVDFDGLMDKTGVPKYLTTVPQPVPKVPQLPEPPPELPTADAMLNRIAKKTKAKRKKK